MRNLKKILAMALTVLMVVGSFAMTATAAFDDVTDYQEAIDVMYELGIAKGISDTEFAPDESVTREQMALWIAKIMTGKVDDTYVTNNFLGAVENLTAFADLEEENYVGAINYAANNGIIVGTSATTFEATEAIKIQDVFAMVVRMLGYGSTAMNNNYPWSFIDKAISLGLDADLPADYSNEAEATRGETMQILFNALTALKSDGSTLGYDFFGLEKATVVITGTSKGNMYTGAELVTKTVDGEDFVSFSILNANGTVASDKATYYILKSAFGIEGNAQFSVGNSYVVRTVDGFASFLTVEECDSVVVDQDVIVGGTSTSASQEKYVTVDGVKYELVEKYSDFVTVNEDEILFLNPAGYRTEVYDAASYVMDSKLNILADDGVGPNGDGILLHWVTTYGVDIEGIAYANLNGMYLYQIGTDANDKPIYIQPNDYIWSLAKKHSIDLGSDFGFQSIMKSYTNIEKKDAYSDTILYDDDADGNYDRAIYFQYKFGKIGYSTSGATIKGTTYPYLTANGVAVDSTRAKTVNAPHYKTGTYYYDADGNELTYDDIAGKFVLYCYIPLYKTMIVKEIFEGQTGLVTGVDLANKTITLNAFGANIITGVVAGEQYTIGNEKLSGAEYASLYALNGLSTKALYETIGKNINFIEKDGKILAIYDAVNDAKHMVYVGNPTHLGYTTMGYSNVLAYYDAASSKIAASQSVITLNAVNNYWYSSYVNTALGTNELATGNLLAATKDSLGNYDVSVVPAVNGTYNSYTKVIVAEEAGRINIANAVVSSDVYGYNDVTETTYNFTPFKANASTVWIIFDGEDNFVSFTGIPANGAYIAVDADDVIYYETSSYENYVYVYGGEFKGEYNQNLFNPWGTLENESTIVYVTTDTIQSMQANNAYPFGTGIVLGQTYSYTKAIDVIKGGYADTFMTDYNFNGRLAAGNFYLVKDGLVVEKIDLTDEDSVIKSGKLLYADNDSAWTAKLYTGETATAIDEDEDGALSQKVVISATEFVGDANVIEYKNSFPYVYYIEADGGVFYNANTLLNVLDYYDNSTANASYYATASAVGAAYKADDLNYVDVYYYAGAEYAGEYAAAPVFIQPSATQNVLTLTTQDASDKTAAEEEWAEELETLTADVTVVAWDAAGSAYAKATELFITNADKLTVTADGTPFTLTSNSVDKLYATEVAVTDPEEGATIYITAKSADLKDKIDSFKYIATQDGEQYTFETVTSTTRKYNIGTTEYTEIAVKVTNEMIVNLDTTKAPTEDFINNAVIKLVILCK